MLHVTAEITESLHETRKCSAYTCVRSACTSLCFHTLRSDIPHAKLLLFRFGFVVCFWQTGSDVYFLSL